MPDLMFHIFNVGITADHHLALLYSTSNKFRMILGEFPDLLQPTVSLSAVPHGVHDVQHFILTSGPPTHARTRRLSPDKLDVDEHEFEEMEQMGIVRRSNRPWSSPVLQYRSESTKNWRM